MWTLEILEAIVGVHPELPVFYCQVVLEDALDICNVTHTVVTIYFLSYDKLLLRLLNMNRKLIASSFWSMTSDALCKIK